MIHEAHWGVARSDMASTLQLEAAKRVLQPYLPIYDRYFPEFADELRAAFEGKNVLYDQRDLFSLTREKHS